MSASTMPAIPERPFSSLSVGERKRLLTETAEQQRSPSAPVEWVYAIQAGGYGGDIKIGISRDPVARLATLQVGSSEPLRGVAAWRGSRADEKALHAMYASHRLHGEWFRHSLPMWRLLRDFGGDFEWGAR